MWGIRMVIPKDIASLFMLLDVHWHILGKGEVWKTFPLLSFNRLGWWIKAKQSLLLLSIDEFIADPILVEKRLLNAAISVTHTVWQLPHVGWLKFNVDGALGAGGNVGGIGGVLSDECGQHLLTFSIRVGSGFLLCRKFS
ncbi:hypothetical protein V6N11_027453 [Hibiscus sabdariffa]|uniref:RNase H type-1 domain-containing protein n=1 Tax=Hibiscus sabdariffa TaxID=183260 RepID=A0ABR2PGY5_9ROSI